MQNKRIVVKVGTSTLSHPSGLLNIRRVEELCKVCSDLKNAGHELVLVSSGAVAMGVGKLSLAERPKDIPGKQAAAAVGQCELMYIYDKLFSQYHHVVAQVLITADDIETPERAKNFHNTLARLLQLRTLPIINENDTVATQELGIGDNDTLAAIVARTIRADLLILFSDIDGLFTADPHSDPAAKLIPVVERLTPEIELGARSLLVDLAKIGFGVAGVTREFVQGELAAGEIRELSTAFSIPPRTVDLCMLRNVSPSAATERFARDVLEKLQGKSVSV